MTDDVVARLRAAGCVFAEEEAALLRGAASGAALETLIGRRVAGEPLEQVLGWAGFAGMRIAVAPGLFVPRRRTELVARIAAQRAPRHGIVIDLCCGVGAIAAAVARARADVTVVAADVDPAAVRQAAANLGPHVRAVPSDMDAELGDLAGVVDVVVACPPYVPTSAIAAMPREARSFEPTVALDGGADGTELQARVFQAAARLLRAGGFAVVETSADLADLTVSRARAAGLNPAVERDDDLGATVVVATKEVT